MNGVFRDERLAALQLMATFCGLGGLATTQNLSGNYHLQNHPSISKHYSTHHKVECGCCILSANLIPAAVRLDRSFFVV
jgi:hypothetical protein